MQPKKFTIKSINARYHLSSIFILTLISTFACITALAIPAYGNTLGSTKIYYSTGEKSQTSGIQERDLSGYFSYYKYGIRVTAEPLKKFFYSIAAEDYHKSFNTKNEDLNNRTNLYKLYVSIPVYKTDDTRLSLKTKYGLRVKRYKNSPSDEYDNNNLSTGIDVTKNKNYRLGLYAGIRDYDYIKDHGSDQLKSFFKIAPKIKVMDNRLSLSGYYRRDMVKQKENKKDYSEDCVSIRAGYDIGKPILDKLKGHFGYGRNDTRDDKEDREDNLRFEYQVWDATLYSKPFKNIEGNITYGQQHRKYFTSIDGYDNWYIDKNIKIKLFKKRSFSTDMLLGAYHKETTFFENEALSYRRNSLDAGFNILKRSDFSIKPSFNYTKYIYPPLSTRNEKDYKVSINCKKYIGSTDKALEAGYWYEWKNYEYSADTRRWSLNLSFTLSF